MSCQSCGRSLAANLRFCDACGADVKGEPAGVAAPFSQQLKSELRLDRLMPGKASSCSPRVPSLDCRNRSLYSMISVPYRSGLSSLSFMRLRCCWALLSSNRKPPLCLAAWSRSAH